MPLRHIAQVAWETDDNISRATVPRRTVVTSESLKLQ